ncbi:U2-type spliceosomal complex subunit CWC15 NDAI_0J00840 [Naumovozyma dairenensis CBS 421]|uniref:Uncharacterized protein n=1 Tax=Naumovozyma dairenensis (strain ATCC 10597 / BCRC 20456 / CBS 421 / NBRC 0211 / NRRL Y-12639) TaxID=1071378 RepID=G0WGP8_NAUDC|nr:hypothetical protein NDAI_0J00840 [Naumovozyma dairenensis CBS 421]CCD26976.1 hypothetical protein NDAI_0J00840 [Naumovozyma dairenensis CBS 421]
MTTSHRPQLEARNGGKSAAYTPTSIQHARLLPGHKTLKIRSNTKKKVDSSEQEKDYGIRSKVNEDGFVDARNLYVENVKNSGADGEKDGNTQTNLTIESDGSRIGSTMLPPQDKKEEMINSTVPSGDVPAGPVKVDAWRTKTTFSRKKVVKSTENKKRTYVNNLTKSKYHQDFLHKFVK